MSRHLQETDELAAQALQAAQAEASAGQSAQAEALYRAVLQLLPANAQAHFGLACLDSEAGRLEAAVAHFAAALEAEPEREAYWTTYIDVLIGARQFATAGELVALGRRHGLPARLADAYEGQLAANGAPGADDIDRAATLFATGQDDRATSAAQVLIQRFPQHAFGWKLLGALHYKRGLLAPAIEAMRKSLAYAPDDAETLSNLGLALKRAGALDEARSVLERSIALRPQNSHAHNNLASTLQEMGHLAAAHCEATAALELDPENSDAWNTVAVVLGNLGRRSDAIDAYQRVLAHDPNDTEAHGNMLFCMSHMQDLTAQALFEAHRQFGQRLERRLGKPLATGNTRDPARPLRIGFVSGDLRNHAMARFVEPVFQRLAGRTGLMLHAYYTYPLHDDTTTRLRAHMDQWRDVSALGDAALDAQIRADGIDILIDLSGHTGHNRLPVFARKPAPLQATWIGYPGTTGLATMDYLLTDRHTLPPGRYDHLFTEKLVHLRAAVCFDPDPVAPALAGLPALTNGYPTFGSFNRLNKISREVAAAWGKLLRSVPNARLIVAGMPINGGAEQLAAWLREEGVGPQHASFHERTGMRAYLAMHNQVDIALDTFPYTGGTTTLHALHMGVPTLSLSGATMAGRQTAGLLEHHGLSQFIAHDIDEFVNKAQAASHDLAGLAAIRANLRGQSPLWTPPGQDRIVDSLEQALRLMWQRWCAGLPPASFGAP